MMTLCMLGMKQWHSMLGHSKELLEAVLASCFTGLQRSAVPTSGLAQVQVGNPL